MLTKLSNPTQTNITKVASQRYFYDIPFDEINSVISTEDRIKVMEILKEGNFTSQEEMKNNIVQMF